MRIEAFSTVEEIAPFSETWDRLAGGMPMRSWAWVSSWCRHYGLASTTGTRLMVLGIYDEADRLVGLAPWYLHCSAAKGWVLRWLGTGEVASDYLSILCQPDDTDRVVETLADYLTGPNCVRGGPYAWDLLEVDGVAAADAPVGQLLERLGERNCTQHENTPVRCWRLTLPASWEEYLKTLSKGHRKKLRRADQNLFATGRAVLRGVENMGQLNQAWDTLVALHQKRRQMLGEPGCFASPQFTAFHREVTRALLAAGQLQLFWLELDGHTVAIQYQMMSQGIIYVYQAGIDTDRLEDEPGHLITAATIKQAIAQGDRAIDFLRGDEPYKPHFRAEPQPLFALRVIPDRPLPRLRNRLYLTGRKVKRWCTRTGPGYETPAIGEVK